MTYDGAIDWRTLPARDGFTLTARKYYDTDSTPDDYDCYTAKQVTAWRADEWQFVGLRVTASVDGIELGSADLWSIEDGRYTCTTEDDVVTDVRDLDPLTDEDYLTTSRRKRLRRRATSVAKLCAKVVSEK